MFQNFLTDDKVYDELEKFWIQMFEDILTSTGEKLNDWFVPFYTTTFSNGQKFFDGNPIFSAKSKICQKSVRVIQYKLITENGELVVWFDEMEKNELVISCQLSNAIWREVMAVIETFIRNK